MFKDPRRNRSPAPMIPQPQSRHIDTNERNPTVSMLPLVEAISDLRKMGYNIHDIIRESGCDSAFLNEVYTALQLPIVDKSTKGPLEVESPHSPPPPPPPLSPSPPPPPPPRESPPPPPPPPPIRQLVKELVPNRLTRKVSSVGSTPKETTTSSTSNEQKDFYNNNWMSHLNIEVSDDDDDSRDYNTTNDFDDEVDNNDVKMVSGTPKSSKELIEVSNSDRSPLPASFTFPLETQIKSLKSKLADAERSYSILEATIAKQRKELEANEKSLSEIEARKKDIADFIAIKENRLKVMIDKHQISSEDVPPSAADQEQVKPAGMPHNASLRETPNTTETEISKTAQSQLSDTIQAKRPAENDGTQQRKKRLVQKQTTTSDPMRITGTSTRFQIHNYDDDSEEIEFLGEKKVCDSDSNNRDVSDDSDISDDSEEEWDELFEGHEDDREISVAEMGEPPTKKKKPASRSRLNLDFSPRDPRTNRKVFAIDNVSKKTYTRKQYSALLDRDIQKAKETADGVICSYCKNSYGKSYVRRHMRTHHDIFMYICPGCNKSDKVLFNFQKHLEYCPDYAKLDKTNKKSHPEKKKDSSSPKTLPSLPSLKTSAKQSKENTKATSSHQPKISSLTGGKKVLSLNKSLTTSFSADSTVSVVEPKRVKERVNSGVSKKSFLNQTKIVKEPVKEQHKEVVNEPVTEHAKKVLNEPVKNFLSTVPKEIEQAKQYVPTLPKAYKLVNANNSKPVDSSRGLELFKVRSSSSNLNKSRSESPKESAKSISDENSTEAVQENRVSESSRFPSSNTTPPLPNKPRFSPSWIAIAKEDSNSVRPMPPKEKSPLVVQPDVKRVSSSEPPATSSKEIALPNVSRSPPFVSATLPSRNSNSNLQGAQNLNQMVPSMTQSSQVSDESSRGILVPIAARPLQVSGDTNPSASVPPSAGPVVFANNNVFPPQHHNNYFPPQQPQYGYAPMTMNIPAHHVQNQNGNSYAVFPQPIHGPMQFIPNEYPNGGVFHGQPVAFQPVQFAPLPVNIKHSQIMNARIPVAPVGSVSPPVVIKPEIANESEVPAVSNSSSCNSNERALVKFGPDILTEVGKDDEIETMEDSNNGDIETYTLLYTEEDLVELEKDAREGLDSSRVCYDDWERPRQVYPDLFKKYNIKFCEPESFTSYKTSIKGLKSYVFHPLFNPQKLKSLTYSNKINSEQMFCPRELEGKECDQSTCEYQHWKTISKNDTMILLDLRNDIPAENNDEYKKRFIGLSDLLMSSGKADLAEVYQKIKDYRMSFLKEGEYLSLSERK
ncbi:unnamed protein product [Ambrosiozyma monospora]|uniref:Unnamed protein product n=1 Tax=Ambrosiozyma monospora TaxID=43982 RepID=A0A9W7DHZ7_AMBMO|nr:unnamed protein product [Ambrosiozyma monospora]